MSLGTFRETDIERLKDLLMRCEIKGLILDIDATLCNHGSEVLDEDIVGRLNFLKEDISLCFASNNGGQRNASLSRQYDIPVAVASRPKPYPDLYQNGMHIMGTTRENTAMGGDRAITDIAGANRLGIMTLQFEPMGLQTEPTKMKIARRFEKAIYQFIMH